MAENPDQSKQASEQNNRVVTTNRKALRDYFVLEKREAGLELLGTEVKSIRQGRLSLDEGYASIDKDQVYLHGVNILPYDHGNQFNHEAARPRRLLLHKKEILKLTSQLSQQGFTLVPLRLYFKRGRVKVELGICKGKQFADKRETLKRRTADREAERAMAQRRRS